MPCCGIAKPHVCTRHCAACPERLQHGLIVDCLLACHIGLTQISVCCRSVQTATGSATMTCRTLTSSSRPPGTPRRPPASCPSPRRPPACAPRWASRARTARPARLLVRAASAAPSPGTPRSAARARITHRSRRARVMRSLRHCRTCSARTGSSTLTPWRSAIITPPVATLFVHHGLHPWQAHEQRQRRAIPARQNTCSVMGDAAAHVHQGLRDST